MGVGSGLGVMVGEGACVLVNVGRGVFVEVGDGEITCVEVLETIARIGTGVFVGVSNIAVSVGSKAGITNPIACFTNSGRVA